ncbi:MAG TPA: ABC transporter permease [Vicinamibacterales bacterium]|jgi:peptide/nickel transport system permease protein
MSRAIGVLLIGLIIAALAAPALAPYPPDRIDLASMRRPPSTIHWLGTDDLGRDVFARVMAGARVSLAVGLLSAAVAGATGVAIGGAAGYLGGAADAVLMRGTDAMLAVPRLPLLMIAAALLQPSVALLVVFIGLTGWMETARVVRAEFRTLRSRGFVESARAAGAGHLRIVVAHLLPNAAQPAVVSITLAVARAILLESALSFFGVGVRPPQASWGNMLYQSQATMSTAPWLALAPGVFIVLTTVTVNLAGERAFNRSRAGYRPA